MAYISKEQVKAVRVALRKEFPSVKFSVTKEHCSSLNIAIMESDIEFTVFDKYSREFVQCESVSPYWIKDNFAHNEKARDFLLKVKEIAENINPVKIVSRDTDYGDWPNYYLNIRIGKWDRPYILRAA